MFKENSLDFNTWEKILDPTVPNTNDLERGTKLWFQQMRNKDTTIPTKPIKHNTTSYQASWAKMKEHTSSHPGLHFGHFKAINKDSPLSAKVHAILADIPLQTGYSPTQWRRCTNAILRKKKNDLRPAKLRLVTLMDTVFNHNNKAIGKAIMNNGENNKAFAEE